MILAVDIGNSRAKFGLFRGTRLVKVFDRLPARLPPLSQVAVSSVNPPALRKLRPRLRRLGPVRIAGKDLPIPLQNLSRGTGADRLLGAYAAWLRAKGPVVVIDVGTAITLNVVDAKGRFLGGAIFTGPRLALKALAESTALLPEITPSSEANIGKDTRSAIRAGAALAYGGFLLEGLSAAAKALGRRPRLFVTGGDGSLLGRTHPHLVLEGLAAAIQAA
jgi:type III pantothenate kinase